MYRDFPGAPVVEISTSDLGAYGFNPWLRRWDPAGLMAKGPKIMEQKQYCSKFNTDFENGPHQKKKIEKRIMCIVQSLKTKTSSLQTFKVTYKAASPS